MNNLAIKVDGLGKRYRIGRNRSSRQQKSLATRLASPFEYLVSTLREPEPDEILWALKDVSFQVEPGEVIGIIGFNGSGKSTLLKILSRITDPTEGRAYINGRVGSLLEVGTGFHVELTGRENIYLSGAILGMRRAEIDRKFDEIVAFSGVEKFIDTQVKRYSSGMKVRLGFSVAAHLEPEILLIDEVLAVGDYEFQKKCLGKMSEVSQAGRTVLFVSHDLAAVTKLCKRGILLQQGRKIFTGDARSVVEFFLSQGETESGLAEVSAGTRDVAIIQKVGIKDMEDAFTASIAGDKAFKIWVQLDVKQTIKMGQLSCDVLTDDGQCIFATTHIDTRSLDDLTVTPGVYSAAVTIPGSFMNVGTYTLKVQFFGHARGEPRRLLAEAYRPLQFTIERTGSVAARTKGKRRGFITPLFDWDFESVNHAGVVSQPASLVR